MVFPKSLAHLLGPLVRVSRRVKQIDKPTTFLCYITLATGVTNLHNQTKPAIGFEVCDRMAALT